MSVFLQAKRKFFAAKEKILSPSSSKCRTDLKPHALTFAIFLFIVSLHGNVPFYIYLVVEKLFFTLDTGYYYWHFIFDQSMKLKIFLTSS